MLSNQHSRHVHVVILTYADNKAFTVSFFIIWHMFLLLSLNLWICLKTFPESARVWRSSFLFVAEQKKKKGRLLWAERLHLFQLCILWVCLWTQVGVWLVQRLASPSCYLCLSCRWFMCWSPSERWLPLHVVPPGGNQTIKNTYFSLLLLLFL